MRRRGFRDEDLRDALRLGGRLAGALAERCQRRRRRDRVAARQRADAAPRDVRAAARVAHCRRRHDRALRTSTSYRSKYLYLLTCAQQVPVLHTRTPTPQHTHTHTHTHTPSTSSSGDRPARAAPTARTARRASRQPSGGAASAAVLRCCSSPPAPRHRPARLPRRRTRSLCRRRRRPLLPMPTARPHLPASVAAVLRALSLLQGADIIALVSQVQRPLLRLCNVLDSTCTLYTGPPTLKPFSESCSQLLRFSSRHGSHVRSKPTSASKRTVRKSIRVF